MPHSQPCLPAPTPETLTRRIARFERRIAVLEKEANRFSWYRLAAFVLGAGAVWAAAVSLPPPAPALVFLGAALVFALVVGLHRRLDRAIQRFSLWSHIRQTELARLTLDWERLPPPQPGAERSPLDIDLDLSGPRSLHQLLDLAVTREGSARLLAWLTNPIPNPDDILARQQTVRELARLPRFRDRLLLSLRLVSQDLLQGERLLGWLAAPLAARRLPLLLVIGSIGALVNLALLALNLAGILPAYWMLGLVLYFIFYNVFLLDVKEFLAAVVTLDLELDKFRPLLHHLETCPIPESPHLQKMLRPFRDPGALPSAFVRRIKGVTVGVGLRSNPVFGVLLNLFLPWDFLFALLASRLRVEAGKRLPTWLESWYDLEALLSLAGYAHLNPQTAFPELLRGGAPLFQAGALGHPLIPAGRRVCNDFEIRTTGQVFILTGSNMSGKSTFLKTVGVNLCLANAGGPVCARQLSLVPLRLASCMRITDSLADGWSFFYAEVQCLKAILDQLQAEHPYPLVFLIDELLRGTNNRERLLGSRAFIRALIGSKGAGLIASHDLELASLADENPSVANFHFRDRVEGQRLVFDYTLRPGPCTTSNALRIMELEGLPVKTED